MEATHIPDAKELNKECKLRSIKRILGETVAGGYNVRRSKLKVSNKGNIKKLEDYYEHCRQQGNSEATILTKLRLLHEYLSYIKKDVRKVTRKDIEKFLIKKSKEVKLSSLNQFKINLKLFYQWLYKKDEGEYPKIVSWIKPSRVKNERKEILTREEIRVLLNNTVNLRDKCMISMLYDGGLRVGELATLRIKDIYPDEYGFKINVDGKTGTRMVRLIDSVPILKRWLNSHPEKENQNQALFICLARKYGEPLSVGNMYKVVQSIAKKSKINKKIYWYRFVEIWVI